MSAPTPDEILDAVGLSSKALAGGDWPREAVMATVRRLREALVGADGLFREVVRDGAIRRLRAVCDAPARILDAGLEDEAADDPGADHADRETYGHGILDVVADGSSLYWLVVQDGVIKFLEEHDGRKPWARSNLPWPAVPAAPDVKAALEAGSRSPFEGLMGLHRERAVLPPPSEGWAALLAAWTLGTYWLDAFHYFPILLFDGPAERGKTRAAKATLWPSHRGMYTPSPSPATIFRDRACHRVAILLDIEDLPRLLKRGGDLADLALNSFERDGVIRRCTRPDQEPEHQVETFAAYGPTIIATNRSVRDSSPLASRCIRIAMPEAGAQIVPDAMRPDEARLLRARALAWRARMEADGADLPEVNPPFTGRLRDLAIPILRVLQFVAPDWVSDVHSVLQAADRERRVEAASSWESRVAAALWGLRGKVDAGRLYIQTIADRINDGLPESERLTPQQVGTARRQLGLRGGKGGSPPRAYIVWPGTETAKALHNRHTLPDEVSEEPEGLDAPEGTSANTGSSALPTSVGPRKGREQVGNAHDPHDSYIPSDPSDGSGFADSPGGRRVQEDDENQGDLPFEPTEWRGPDDDDDPDDDRWDRDSPLQRPPPDAGGAAIEPGVDL